MVHAIDETPFAKHRGGDHWYAPLPITTNALSTLVCTITHNYKCSAIYGSLFTVTPPVLLTPLPCAYVYVAFLSTV